MRNPLTAALAAMAAHTVAAIALRWPYPSVATFAAGILAAVGALVDSGFRRGVTRVLPVAVLAPPLLPTPLLAVGLAALLVHGFRLALDPLRNLAVALPSLVVLALALTA